MDSNQYMGNPYQMYGTRHYTLHSDTSSGVAAIDVRTGSGFEYTVLPTRAMDISLATYKGINLTYLTPGGECHPSYFTNRSDNWLQSFFGGLLTTCGPSNIGRACSSGGRDFGLHDRFTNTPAKNVCDTSRYEKSIKITGVIDFGVLCEDKIRVFRTIESSLYSSSVTITDKIENYGYASCPLTILYHTNYGYPLLTEKARVYVNADEIEPYDDYSSRDFAHIYEISPPDGTIRQKNYFHTMKEKNGLGYAAIVNPALKNLGVLLSFTSSELPYLTHCKNENPIDYLLALEPCNTLCIGRSEIEKRGLLPQIKPGEIKTIQLTISVFEGEETTKHLLPLFEQGHK